MDQPFSAAKKENQPQASTTFSQEPSNQRRDLLQLLDQDLDNNIKSATLKSTQADYTTPPESPVMPHPLFKTVGESTEKPPVPPPRQKRHQKSSPSASQNKSEDSTAVLEEVAKDLIRMSSEID